MKRYTPIESAFLAFVCIASLSASLAEAAPRLGRAVIVALDGSADYVDPDKRQNALELGMALSHGHTLRTASDGSFRSMLTPGAMLCAANDTLITLEQLEILTEGLPGAQKPVKRTVALGFEKGAIRVHLGEEANNITVTVKTAAGEFSASMGAFLIQRINSTIQGLCEKGDLKLTTPSGEVVEIGDNGIVNARLLPAGEVTTDVSDGADAEECYRLFHACREHAYLLEPYFVNVDFVGPQGIDAAISAPAIEVVYVGETRHWYDVSPTVRPFSIEERQFKAGRDFQPPAEAAGRWDRARAWEWYRALGAVSGVNYIPRNAVNSTDMWQASTYDRATIDEELGWAARSGFNSVRVFLPYIVWEDDPDGLTRRLKGFLDMAEDHELSVAFVLFDDYRPAGKDPYLGPQDQPVAGVRFSAWTPSPGHALVADVARWPNLERYVKDIIETFKDDSRVLFWDLYNTAGRDGTLNQSLPLVEKAFEWAREVNPSQPLTTALWAELDNEPAKRLIALSDIVAFQSYASPVTLEDRLMLAKIAGRPVLCVEWLSRTRGTTFEATLPIFSFHGVGWFNWGLVKGKVQSYMPWDAEAGTPEPAVWEQDVLREDGTPFDENEIKWIKGFSFGGY